MFKLNKEDIDHAKGAVDHHGYSTMLPDLAEWKDITDNWTDVREELCSIDLDDYCPMAPLVVTAAKNERSIRRLHLLHPYDMLLYTSLTLRLKNCVEACRVPIAEGRVHSYRASTQGDRIYDTTKDVHGSYMACLSQKVRRKDVEFVGVTDIANFYSSISHSRLQQLLEDVAITGPEKDVARVVSNFTQCLMGPSRAGIPTGPFASRLLAEVVLNDIDRHLLAKDVDFVRWVDDFNVFSSSYADAQRTIVELSAWLDAEHNLSLQMSKTHVVDADQYADAFLTDLSDILYEQVMTVFDGAGNYDVEDGDGEPEDMEDADAVALIEMLVDAVPNHGSVNFRVVDFALRRLRRILLDRRTADELLTILMENLDRLVPSIEDVTKLISIIRPENERQRREIGLRLLTSIERVGYVDHYGAWILTVFVRDERWGCVDELVDMFRTSNSDVVRRYAALAVAKAGHGARLVESATSVSDESVMVRLALLKAGINVPERDVQKGGAGL